MGWWGCRVMEGDSPCDIGGVIVQHALGLPENSGNDEISDEEFAREHEAYLAALRDVNTVNRLFAGISGIARQVNADVGIATQVLGFVVMNAGGPISVFRDELVSAIVNDAWANSTKMSDAAERKHEMGRFLLQVAEYIEGTPMKIEQRGLIEMMQTAVTQDLVNSNPALDDEECDEVTAGVTTVLINKGLPIG